MAEVSICSAAEVDYTESLCWYSERDLDVAKDFDEEFDRAILQIAADPERFPTCDVRHRFFLMRRFPFQIIYRIRDDNVMIIAVAHISRDPDYWSQRSTHFVDFARCPEGYFGFRGNPFKSP